MKTGSPARAVLTLALSMTLENSPIQRKQWSGVTSRKQSPLFRDDALGSTSLVWTWRRPGEKTPPQRHRHSQRIYYYYFFLTYFFVETLTNILFMSFCLSG